MKTSVRIALIVVTFVTIGCATANQSSTPNIPETVEAAIAAAFPTATPSPTPNIDSTVEAGIQATLAAIPSPTVTTTIMNTPIPTLPASLSNTVQRIRPAIVRIETTRGSSRGSGTGVIIESVGQTGVVLTNFHVIEGANLVRVTVNDSRTYSATIRGVDSTRDLAILNICCGTFHHIGFGSASDAQPGTEVFSMGYPLNLSGSATVTTGIVSAMRYEASERRWVIQSDAAINPGNSGGPMLLSSGKMIGINTFKYETSASGRPVEGLGFAVSEATIQQHLATLKSGSYRVSPTPTPRPTRTPTPRPISIPFVYDDYGDNRFAAASAYLTAASSPLVITGEIESPGDVDTFSFQSTSGDSFAFSANYLLRGSIVTAIGHPKLVLYNSSPSVPLAVDDRAGDLFYNAAVGGTIYLDVSSYKASMTSSYRIVVDRIPHTN